jgi:hypothetical protein
MLARLLRTGHPNDYVRRMRAKGQITLMSDFLQTQLPAVQAATLAAVTQQVANLNAAAISNFQTAWQNWLLNWTAGRVTDKTTAPKPPFGYVVGYFNDPTTGPGSLGPYGDTVIQWAYPALGNTPVCVMPLIPDVPPPQVHPVVNGNGSVMNVPAGDVMPVGSILPAPDGSKWEKMASPTPFGMAYYYAKVN